MEGKTIQEIAKEYDAKEITLYSRRRKLFPNKEISKVDGLMRFDDEEIEELLKFVKRGKK